jgi:hypothetical protein
MRHLLSILAVGMLGLGGHHFYLHMKINRKKRIAQRRLEVWEGEGGAVPVARTRTAAQIAPRKRRRASPRADA